MHWSTIFIFFFILYEHSNEIPQQRNKNPANSTQLFIISLVCPFISFEATSVPDSGQQLAMKMLKVFEQNTNAQQKVWTLQQSNSTATAVFRVEGSYKNSSIYVQSGSMLHWIFIMNFGWFITFEHVLVEIFEKYNILFVLQPIWLKQIYVFVQIIAPIKLLINQPKSNFMFFISWK